MVKLPLIQKIKSREHPQYLLYQAQQQNFKDGLILSAIIYEGCSNMNASSFITFFTYKLRQNDRRLYKGLYVNFKLASDLKRNTVYLSSYSPSNKGHVVY